VNASSTPSSTTLPWPNSSASGGSPNGSFLASADTVFTMPHFDWAVGTDGLIGAVIGGAAVFGGSLLAMNKASQEAAADRKHQRELADEDRREARELAADDRTEALADRAVEAASTVVRVLSAEREGEYRDAFDAWSGPHFLFNLRVGRRHALASEKIHATRDAAILAFMAMRRGEETRDDAMAWVRAYIRVIGVWMDDHDNLDDPSLTPTAVFEHERDRPKLPKVPEP
jgi:hypothetical protein